MNEELLQRLPHEYAALADRRRVMLEVADELVELHGATIRLGDALEAAGLPGRDWRSRDATLRLIARKLPEITVDRFITRLSEFAAGNGPDWLHGDDDDLDRFHGEVESIHRLAARLSDTLEQRAQVMERPRREWAIVRAFGDAQVMAALRDVVEILEDFRALRPFMAPLSPSEWGEKSKLAIGAELTGGVDANGRHDTLPLPAAQGHTRLRDFARATMSPRTHGGPKDPIEALLVRVRSLLAPGLRRRPIVAITLLLVAATGLAALAVHHLGATSTAISGSQSTSATASASSAHTAVPAVATSIPAAHPTATKTTAPAPQLALTCKVDSQGSSATLTIKNVGVASITWQGSANRGLTVTPSQGELSVGQIVDAQITGSRRGVTNSTVTVTASSSGRSASYSATCQ